MAIVAEKLSCEPGSPKFEPYLCHELTLWPQRVSNRELLSLSPSPHLQYGDNISDIIYRLLVKDNETCQAL